MGHEDRKKRLRSFRYFTRSNSVYLVPIYGDPLLAG